MATASVKEKKRLRLSVVLDDAFDPKFFIHIRRLIEPSRMRNCHEQIRAPKI